MFPDCCPTGAELNPIICIITSQAFNFSVSVCRSVEYRATVGILIKTKIKKQSEAFEQEQTNECSPLQIPSGLQQTQNVQYEL